MDAKTRLFNRQCIFMTQADDDKRDMVNVQTYYTTRGPIVIEHRKIGDGKWEEIETAYTQPPYIIQRWVAQEEIDQFYKK